MSYKRIGAYKDMENVYVKTFVGSLFWHRRIIKKRPTYSKSGRFCFSKVMNFLQYINQSLLLVIDYGLRLVWNTKVLGVAEFE
jgi:hypothetical protein